MCGVYARLALVGFAPPPPLALAALCAPAAPLLDAAGELLSAAVASEWGARTVVAACASSVLRLLQELLVRKPFAGGEAALARVLSPARVAGAAAPALAVALTAAESTPGADAPRLSEQIIAGRRALLCAAAAAPPRPALLPALERGVAALSVLALSRTAAALEAGAALDRGAENLASCACSALAQLSSRYPTDAPPPPYACWAAHHGARAASSAGSAAPQRSSSRRSRSTLWGH